MPRLAALLLPLITWFGSPPAQAQHPLTRPDLEAWLDGLLPYALAEGDVAGAVVVVVKDGRVLLEKGYGYADAARRVPVDPERTLLRPGSVAKLFTWTAVMQLVEQGKLDLDRDVNEYLDFRIAPAFGRPVTLRDLMTHTPGFEEIIKNLMAYDSARSLPLRPYLRTWTPNRVYPPGQVPAYSNYGVAVAGYIIERVSGERFDDYIERHIFAPLGMSASSFRQPLPPRLRPAMSQGYRLGSAPPQPYELVGPAPAGALASTGSDMGRFMIAHLQDGAYESTRILRAETAQLMHGTALPIIPPLHSMLLGFMQADLNGRRIIGHDGDTQFFHSSLSLFIDDGVGLYLSVNSTGKEGAAGPLRTWLLERFADRYFPGPSDDRAVDVRTAAEHARLLAGAYEPSRRAQSSFLSLFFLPGQLRVSVGEGGTLAIPAFQGVNGQPKQWREVAPFVWNEVGGKERLAAKVENGRVVMFSVDGVSPFDVFLPAPWWRSSVWLLPLLGGGLSALLMTLVAWPVGAGLRRRYGVAFPLTGIPARAHRLTRIAALATVAVIAGWAATLMPVATDLAFYSPRIDWWIWLIHVLSLIVFLGAAAIGLWNAWVTWTTRTSWLPRVWSAVLGVAFLSVLWVGAVFKLMAVGANY
jgi:CubicO group peptidase (beta-lactamase class C family)